MMSEIRRVAIHLAASMAASNDGLPFYMESGYWQIACIYVAGMAATMSVGVFKYLPEDNLNVLVADTAGAALVLFSAAAVNLTQLKPFHSGAAGNPVPFGAGNYFFRTTLTGTFGTSSMSLYVGLATV